MIIFWKNFCCRLLLKINCDIVNIWLMLSVSIGPKVITSRGLHCILIFVSRYLPQWVPCCRKYCLCTWHKWSWSSHQIQWSEYKSFVGHRSWIWSQCPVAYRISSFKIWRNNKQFLGNVLLWKSKYHHNWYIFSPKSNI